jgi:hypothetical protein
MLPKTEPDQEKNKPYDWSELTQFWLDEMLADPDLTDEQKQQLLREMELPEEEWKLPEFPEGAEPLSVTVIRMRRGE